jgi:cell division protein FtsN
MVVMMVAVVIVIVLLLLEAAMAAEDVMQQPSPAALQELHKAVCSLKPSLPECVKSVPPKINRNSKVAGAPRPRRRSSIKGASPWRPLGSDTNWY